MSTATREVSNTTEIVARSPGLRNLYQRLSAIAGAVGQIKATGKTRPMRGAPDGKPVLSIVDVEDALRNVMAEHGVVSGYRWNAPPTIVGTLGEEGNVSLWQADLTVWLVNADTPDDRTEDRIYDIGTSPSAAVSFALKRYFRALFHLAEETDETRPVGEQRARPPVRPQRPVAKPVPSRGRIPFSEEAAVPTGRQAGGEQGLPAGLQAGAGAESSGALASEQATAGLSSSPIQRLRKLAEVYHQRDWKKCEALVGAQARGIFHKGLDELNNEEVDHLGDELDALIQSRDSRGVKP